MGDRGNIAVIQSANNGQRAQVWLYSHWGGSNLPAQLQAGLAAGKNRWQDESYLIKVLFGYALPEDAWRREIGSGISARMQDNEHDILVVDIPKQRVFTMEEAELDENGQIPAIFEARKYWSFEEYSNPICKLPEI